MTEKFKLVSQFTPSGDQPTAIASLVEGISTNQKHQVLLGATGTGKTYTISQVIAKVNKPTLVFAHNKTLAGQLYSEFKQFFPENKVEYFVSNFDYYQPEAYMPKSDTYIEKTSMINQELDMMRLSALNSLLQRNDTIVVASVACIYASSDPSMYKEMLYLIKVGQEIDRQEFLSELVTRQYTRTNDYLQKGQFRVRGDVVEIMLGYRDDRCVRIEFFENEIERICETDPLNGTVYQNYSMYQIFPANEYARQKEQMKIAAEKIEEELDKQIEFLNAQGKLLEAQRLSQRTKYDLEMLRETGSCKGIENYSQHIDGRSDDQRPFNLFDYFPDDFLLVIDESHQSIPQIKAMYNGDRSRKETLVNYGFRLPSALNNRPMRFEEFEEMVHQVIYVSATPGPYELEKTNKHTIQQIIRPTGLLDPIVDVRGKQGQIDDLLYEIKLRIKRNERVIITTTTVKMAEDLSEHLANLSIKVGYLHHETKTIERIDILRSLRLGKIDVVIGINLLREGIDLPEVSLICILDADMEGFLRSQTALIQIIGRAARNANGQVIMYADKMTSAMEAAIKETNRRRSIQMEYNKQHNITPKTVVKSVADSLVNEQTKSVISKKGKHSKQDISKAITQLREQMKEAARVLDFEKAAQLRDLLFELENDHAK